MQFRLSLKGNKDWSDDFPLFPKARITSLHAPEVMHNLRNYATANRTYTPFTLTDHNDLTLQNIVRNV